MSIILQAIYHIFCLRFSSIPRPRQPVTWPDVVRLASSRAHCQRFKYNLLPSDATQSAVMPQYVSVRPVVRDVKVP